MKDIKNQLRHARTLYNSEFVDNKVNRHNQRNWVRMVAMLGDRRLLAIPIRRRAVI